MFAKFYKFDKDELFVAWLSGRLFNDLQDENLVAKALRVTEKN